jgi:A/G-specific adenine glycosylase
MDRRFKDFGQTVWRYYHKHGRHDLPWRQPQADGSFDSYKILVSEIMLQQTQVSRVIPKYQLFLKRFPSFTALATAPLGDVLRAWNGLGYNRRAKFLWQCARQVMTESNGHLPGSAAELTQLPGIGANTAGAVLSYAFNKPALFVETNIRTVFIHHFFAGRQAVSDREILDLIAKTLPDQPRLWYWALMDYGTHLKQTIGNLNALSKHYAKQSPFVGSKRQIRGQVLRLLAERPLPAKALKTEIPDGRLQTVLQDLTAEGFIVKTARCYQLTS